MPAFAYTGRDTRGEAQRGVVDAPDTTAAADILIGRGITPVTIAEQAAAGGFALKGFSLERRKITDDDIMLFSRQMYTLMKAGVPILQALAGLRESTHVPAFAEVISQLRESLDSGRELSIALSDTGAFGTFYVSMIRVGEMTGRLDLIFLRLYEHLEFEKEMRARIKSALRYPTFVIIAMAAAITIINMFVIPAFSKVFASFNAPLPITTRILIGFSEFTVNYWYLIFAGVIALWLAFKSYVKTENGRLRWDRIKLKLPIMGSTIKKATLARFARSFALSLSSGVPITQAFTVVAQVVDNAFIAEKLEQMRQGIERGESILRTAANAKVFTPIVLQMIAVGEESGDVDGLLMEVAEMYEREVEYEVETLSARIEPILIAGLAGLVLVLALGIFLPMWDLGSTMINRK